MDAIREQLAAQILELEAEVRRLRGTIARLGAQIPRDCSICRRPHGSEIQHTGE